MWHSCKMCGKQMHETYAICKECIDLDNALLKRIEQGIMTIKFYRKLARLRLR